MNLLLVAGVGIAIILIAGRTYGRWIAGVFDLDDRRTPPSVANADGADYVATPTQVVFAHHFASIAGAGPILGPIIALAFGWGPAWLWIVIGGVMIGAVHDMSAMCVSAREGGRTIAEIARRTLGHAGFLLFIVFLILVLGLINAIFLNFSAQSLTSLVPLTTLGISAEATVLATEVGADGVERARIGGIATTSVFVMTGFAPLLGLAVRRGLRGPGAFLAAAIVCLVAILLGFAYPIRLSSDLETAQNSWRFMLAAYAFIGCWIPVWVILQPRDFCNVQILYAGLALLVIGVVAGGIGGTDVPMDRVETIRDGTERLGPVWPFLLITIACGAISGFHSLVASGTTIKQIPRESDCRRVGSGAMLLESCLALLVLLTVASFLSGSEFSRVMYEGGGGPIIAFALACGRSFASLGIPVDVGSVLGILIIEGFLVTTLDTAVRLGRYLLEELWRGLFGERTPAWLLHPFVNTAISVGMMLGIAFSSVYDQVWTIFGAGNQLIAALALTTISVWLLRRGRRWLFAAIPAGIMTVTTLTGLAWKIRDDVEKENGVLAVAGAVLLALGIAFAIVATLRVREAIRDAARGSAAG